MLYSFVSEHSKHFFKHAFFSGADPHPSLADASAKNVSFFFMCPLVLTEWLIVYWLTEWLVDWLINGCIHRFNDWLLGVSFIYQSIDLLYLFFYCWLMCISMLRLIDWLTDWLIVILFVCKLTYWWNYRLIDWLMNLFIYFLFPLRRCW